MATNAKALTLRSSALMHSSATDRKGRAASLHAPASFFRGRAQSSGALAALSLRAPPAEVSQAQTVKLEHFHDLERAGSGAENQLDTSAIFELNGVRYKYLGEGTFGIAFEMLGTDEVVKIYSHNTLAGSLLPDDALAELAARQVAAASVLHNAGLPMVATRMGDAPNVVVTEKAKGSSFEDLTPAQQAEAFKLAQALGERASPILSELVGSPIDADSNPGNMHYEVVDGRLAVTKVIELSF